MELINELVEQYAHLHTTPNNLLLQQIEDYTNAHHPKKHMLSGTVQGQLLQMISNIQQPAAVLEIGTFTGYSALCLAEGLQPNGVLHTIEVRPEDAATAQSFFDKSSHKSKIELHLGNAIDIIPTLKHEWDLVFIDADKVQYSAYYDLILPKVKSNGLVIIDNIFFHGDVLQNPIKGKNAIAIAALNEKIRLDNNVDKVLLTVRDGLMIVRKK
jgi:caffeoyl-CoA O-methyltransferase